MNNHVAKSSAWWVSKPDFTAFISKTLNQNGQKTQNLEKIFIYRKIEAVKSSCHPRIPKEFRKNFQRNPQKFPKKFTKIQGFPKNSQRISKYFSKK
jgi:hypothetical protein